MDATWYPFIGAVGLDAGGALGADEFQLLANGPSTATPGSLEDAIDLLWDGLFYLQSARSELEGLPDLDAAEDDLFDAFDSLSVALAVVQALEDQAGGGTPLTPARKQLVKAQKDTDVALTRLDKGKKATSIVQAICKAELEAMKALSALRANLLAEA
jgi:hypothetical protein